MKTKLTEPVLQKFKKQVPTEGRVEISDTLRPGLRLRLSAAGKAVWMYEKRIKGGPKRKHTFGTWPEPISLAEARKLALEIEAEAAKGIDRVQMAAKEKQEAERAEAQIKSLQTVIDTYADLHLSTIRTGDKRKRQIEVALQKHLSNPVGELTRADLQKAVDDKAKEGRLVAANRIRAALLAFSSWAFGRSYIASNIGQGIAKAGRETARERVLDIQEVRAIWNATFEIGPLWGPVFRLFILTVQRRGEILGLRIAELDLERGRIVKPGSQTKNDKGHITHLSPPALPEVQAALADAQERAEEKGHAADYLFTTTGTTPVSGISRAKERLDKILGDKVGPWRIHDIRTAFSTAMADADVPEAVSDRVLNHVAGGSAPSAVSRVYNQAEMLPQRAAALDRWAALVTGESADVIKLEVK
ncbi:integrase family protein [uncultured Sulfitobacter sp.]|uniref:tyrosine-type recombinase/integrase n=1 Tax=uncultured Sulfitobacter sp. TaxID=191468 RepID=UPI002608FE65|nr:integrase family protein [uncultured Sulfitobacter sp.]